ncbi:MAG: hypothetical protein DMG05_01625 [Acidobacteria bacterium]|nr:MAG: hypothetical protein DMG05_01625 [Acidobacteriota bacterium]
MGSYRFCRNQIKNFSLIVFPGSFIQPNTHSPEALGSSMIPSFGLNSGARGLCESPRAKALQP